MRASPPPPPPPPPLLAECGCLIRHHRCLQPNACLSVELREEREGEGGRAAIDRLLTNATMNSNSLSLLLARERGSAHPRHYVHYMLESHAQKCAAQNFFLL